MNNTLRAVPAAICLALSLPVQADEHLFGYVRGAEPLPAGAQELYQWITMREDKGEGRYRAYNLATEYEYGWTHRFSTAAYLKAQAIDTRGLVIDGYLPGPFPVALIEMNVDGRINDFEEISDISSCKGDQRAYAGVVLANPSSLSATRKPE